MNSLWQNLWYMLINAHVHTLPPSSVKKLDFRTGGSVKHNFPYWSEIPNWFRTIQNWVGTIQTISKTLSDLVSYW